MFNFKDTEGQIKFQQMTSETSLFTDCFKSSGPLMEQIEEWQKVFKKILQKVIFKNPYKEEE